MIDKLIKNYPMLESQVENIKLAADIMTKAACDGKMIMTCGNGGSCADSAHIVGELMKSFKLHRNVERNIKITFSDMFGDAGEELVSGLQMPIKAVDLTSQSAVLSAFGNDCESSNAYAQLAFGYGEEGGLLIAISTSGNSENVCRAAMAAKVKGAKVIALVGEKECRLDKLSDVAIHAPSCETYRVQEYHLPIYHYLCAEVEERLFK